MGGVDHFDQTASYYIMDKKSKRSFMRIILHLIEVIVSNSYIFYCESSNNNKKITHLVYREKIIESLLQSNN